MIRRICSECLYRRSACGGKSQACNVFTPKDGGFTWSIPTPEYGPTELFWPIHQWHWWKAPMRSPCCGSNVIDMGTICERVLICSICYQEVKRYHGW